MNLTNVEVYREVLRDLFQNFEEAENFKETCCRVTLLLHIFGFFSVIAWC